MKLYNKKKKIDLLKSGENLITKKNVDVHFDVGVK
jgi:hypothetical protein